MIKKLIVSIIFLPLLFVPLFCCCVKGASAATVGEEHCQDDQDSHSANQDQSDSKHAHSCDCSQVLSTVGDQLIISHPDFSSQQNFSFQTTSIEPFSVISLKSSMRLAYLGPPIGNIFAVPLYTLYHSLRI